MSEQFDIVYADPPWTFRTYSDKGKGKSPEQHYSCMTLEQIKQLPVADVCSPNSVIFLWATWPLIKASFEVLEAWGFEYKTDAFIWIKMCKKQQDKLFTGCGYYSRKNSEVCLLGTRGKGLSRMSRSVHEVIMTPIEEHSKKPEEARRRIEQLFGTDNRRLELFARREVEGWTCMGNEIDGMEIGDALRTRAG